MKICREGDAEKMERRDESKGKIERGVKEGRGRIFDDLISSASECNAKVLFLSLT